MPDLATFFQKKKKRKAAEDSRRRDVREQWLDDLCRLREQLRGWLEPAIREGLEVEDYGHTVREGLLGTYDAPALRLRFGQTEARVFPVARYVLGGTGRVDVEFPGGRVLLVRQAESGDWMIVREDRTQKTPLSQETFAEIIQEAFSQ